MRMRENRAISSLQAIPTTVTANCPITRLLRAISIMTIMIGTAVTPLITALQ
ncbi:hypothetical protein LMG22037_00035 [Paraburkholderia phenoliruptrix]|uniref:Uncharacterized protein n=1 Tax=Paraburkholderia phenoliruptrix TaxID=252970 RepID=A0A6J4ZNV4_9BURK|nr:hypothetical protein LMG22037_00035 [Paraburkholderia phenoliruptrix]